MKQPAWEYRVVSFGGTFSGPKDEELESELNMLGQDGWEAIAVRPHENSNKVTFFLKRRLAGSEPRRGTSWAGW